MKKHQDIMYSIEEGYLVYSIAGKKIWRILPMNYKTVKCLYKKSDQFCVVLLGSQDGPRLYEGGPHKAFNNLLSINNAGDVLWIADLPTSGIDSYEEIYWSEDFPLKPFWVQINLKENSLVALSLSGYLVNIEPKTGKKISVILMK